MADTPKRILVVDDEPSITEFVSYALKKEGTTRKAAEYLNLPQATLARKKVRYGL